MYVKRVVPTANVFQSCSRRVPVWPGRVGVCGGLAVARRDRVSDRVAVGGCCHDWYGIDEAYSVAGETWFGWWLVEHYLPYHVNCPDGCGLGEPARGG